MEGGLCGSVEGGGMDGGRVRNGIMARGPACKRKDKIERERKDAVSIILSTRLLSRLMGVIYSTIGGYLTLPTWDNPPFTYELQVPPHLVHQLILGYSLYDATIFVSHV